MGAGKKNRRIDPGREIPQTGRDVSVAEPRRARNIRLSFEHGEDGTEFCLSRWEKAEVREGMAALRKFTSHTWATVFSTGGRGKNSGGLGYETYTESTFPKPLPTGAPRDVKLFSIRASEKYRIY